MERRQGGQTTVVSEPIRYGIADNQAQRTLGGNVLVVDPAGRLVEYADYARLKALTVEMDKTIYASQAECRRLKAEVEGLMIFCNCTLIPSKELQAQVERLTKAGDVMAIMLQYDEVSKDWNAAKEGKQS
jgi:hypothetical protein